MSARTFLLGIGFEPFDDAAANPMLGRYAWQRCVAGVCLLAFTSIVLSSGGTATAEDFSASGITTCIDGCAPPAENAQFKYQNVPPPSYEPPDGYIPDEATARAVAAIILSRIYGAEEIAGQRPFEVRLKNGRWIVEGRLPEPEPGYVIMGGVAHIELDRASGRVWSLWHGK